MRLVIATYGTEGNARPFVALRRGLNGQWLGCVHGVQEATSHSALAKGLHGGANRGGLQRLGLSLRRS